MNPQGEINPKIIPNIFKEEPLRKILMLIKKCNKNFLFLLFLTVSMTLIRNLLEYYGSKGQYFGLTVTLLLNTYTYVLLMIFPELFILNWLLKGNKEQLRKLIQEGTVLLFILFIIIPVFNIIFNYNFLEFPSFYSIPFLISPHYGPAGIYVAFLLVLFYFPFWLKRIYNLNYFSIFKRTFLLYTIHYLIYYQLTTYFCFIFLGSSFDSAQKTNLWSISFLIPVLILFPFIIKKYSINSKEKSTLKKTYVLIIIVSLWLIPTTIPSTANSYRKENLSFIEEKNNYWNFYFMILHNDNLIPFYGTLLSLNSPAGKTTSLKIANNEFVLIELKNHHESIIDKESFVFFAKDSPSLLIKANLSYSEINATSEDIKIKIRSDSLGMPFWWNSWNNRDNKSQFNKMKGYDDFVTFNISIEKDNETINLFGKGIHELLTIKKLTPSWDKEYWFYFIIEGYHGIYIQYDDYTDGAIFIHDSPKKEKIKRFGIYESENKTLIEIETEKKLFRFDLTPEITVRPYEDVKIYSKSCDCSRDILHEIYKLNKGEVFLKDNDGDKIIIKAGYFQLETLD